jgi:DNA-binding protein HU-beta
MFISLGEFISIYCIKVRIYLIFSILKRKEVSRMLKSDLVRKVQSQTGLTLKAAEEVVNAVFNTISKALAAGDKVLITGFGSFVVRKRRARKGVNPQTLEKIDLPESIIPAFKAGKTLKDLVSKAK